MRRLPSGRCAPDFNPAGFSAKGLESEFIYEEAGACQPGFEIR
jgi:hypothetical protein